MRRRQRLEVLLGCTGGGKISRVKGSMIDLALDTELDAQMKLTDTMTSGCKILLAALNRGEVISLLNTFGVNNHTTRISDLILGKYDGVKHKILKARAPGGVYLLYWKEI